MAPLNGQMLCGTGSPDAAPNESLPISDEAPNDCEDSVQKAFDEGGADALSTPYEYERVAVLLVHWADYLDRHLKCKAELEELKELFRDKFLYDDPDVLELDNLASPQLQLNAGISKWVMEQDAPGHKNLLLIYYTGHGRKRDDRFQVVGVRRPQTGQIKDICLHEPEAFWDPATRDLKTATKSDVLMIIDACYAGSIERDYKKHGNTMEALLASHKDGLTDPPGPRSFTSAFIKALNDIHDQRDEDRKRFFNSFDLKAAIDVHRQHESTQLLRLAGPDCNHRHIRLAPLQTRIPLHRRNIDARKAFRRGEMRDSPAPPAPKTQPYAISHLTLKIGFSKVEKLDEVQADKLVRALATVRGRVPKLGINSITWVGQARNEPIIRLRQIASSIRTVIGVQNFWRQKLCAERMGARGNKRQRDAEGSTPNTQPNVHNDETGPRITKRTCTSIRTDNRTEVTDDGVNSLSVSHSHVESRVVESVEESDDRHPLTPNSQHDPSRESQAD